MLMLAAPCLLAAQQFLISTQAGADRLPFSSPLLAKPASLAIDQQGNTYVSDAYFNRILKIAPSGAFTPLAQIDAPGALAAGPVGDIYVTSLNRILRIDAEGAITTIAANLPQLAGLAIDASANLYASSAGRVLRIDPQGGITELASNLTQPSALAVDAAGEVYAATLTRIVRIAAPPVTVIDNVQQPSSLAIDKDGNLIYSEPSRILRGNAPITDYPGAVAIDPSNNVVILDQIQRRIRVLNSTGTVGAPPAAGTFLFDPNAVALDRDGSLYVTDFADHRVRRVAPDGTVSITASGITQPRAIAIDQNRNLYVASLNRIIRIPPEGAAAVFADNLPLPSSLAFDVNGNLFAATENRVVRITPQALVSTYAANLLGPAAIAFDKDNNLFVAENAGNRIRRITLQGQSSFVAVNLAQPSALAADAGGNLYIAESGAHFVRRISPEGSQVAIAGTGDPGFSGDDGSSKYAALNGPSAIALDTNGRIFLADRGNSRIRRLDPVQITPQSALNFASKLPVPISPGEIVLIDGDGLGPEEAVITQTDEDTFRLPTLAAGTKVLFDNLAAPLLYVQARFVIAAVPFGVNGKESATLQLEVQGRKTNAVRIPVATASPGIYTRASNGKGLAYALNDDSTDNQPLNPARTGSIVTITATGLGNLDPDGEDGVITRADLIYEPILPLTLTIGGQPAYIYSAQSASEQLHGVIRIQAQIPETVAPGDNVPIVLKSGEFTSQPGVFISVQ